MYRLCSVDLEECRVLYLEINQRVDGRSASPHGIQQKMCRDFLSEFAAWGILVAPRKDLKEFMVVGKVDHVSNSAAKFHIWLREQCVTIKSVDRADSASLEECLRYSIVVWLEPHQYYRCGKAVLKGPFLGTNFSSVVRILFSVHCTSAGDVFLRISPETVRLLPLETWQLQETSIEPRWVYCLPKLGRGQLVTRCSDLPPDSGFANYAEMRAYWKNCHGYDLPLKEPENYYSVWFNGIRSSFLYPDFCVLSSEPQPIGFLQEQKTTLAAVDDFSQSFSSVEHFICGEHCSLSPSDSKFVRPPGRALKTTPYSRRTTWNLPDSRREGTITGASMPPQTHEICAGKDCSMLSPTKRLAVATNSSLCRDERAPLPIYTNPLKDPIAAKKSKLLLRSPEILSKKHQVVSSRLPGSQSCTGTVRSRKRCIDVE